VSRTFTPGASASKETRRKVLAAAKELGYRPNALARSLVTRRSRIVALVMSYLENQFYPLVIEHLSQQLRKQRYHVLMFISEGDSVDGIISEILQYQVDAIVMASVTLSAPACAQLQGCGVPVLMFKPHPGRPPVFGWGSVRSRPTTTRVDAWSRACSSSAATSGLRLLRVLENSSTSVERERGFADALPRPVRVIRGRRVGQYSFEGAQRAARELFARAKRPDAVFVAKRPHGDCRDGRAADRAGLARAARRRRCRFDDIPQASWDSYRLTTVTQDVQAMVGATVELLHEQMAATCRRAALSCPAYRGAGLRTKAAAWAGFATVLNAGVAAAELALAAALDRLEGGFMHSTLRWRSPSSRSRSPSRERARAAVPTKPVRIIVPFPRPARWTRPRASSPSGSRPGGASR